MNTGSVREPGKYPSGASGWKDIDAIRAENARVFGAGADVP
jgi:hypothetical protein